MLIKSTQTFPHFSKQDALVSNIVFFFFQNGRFRCLYDYVSGDSDEVSFVEDDVIINPDPIDEGWMYGTVQRTGQRGMLPANYVEPIH